MDDGFVIAEEDLRLRGGGEVLATPASGWRLAASRRLIERASDLPEYILARDAYLTSDRGLAARRCLALFERGDAMRLLQRGEA